MIRSVIGVILSVILTVIYFSGLYYRDESPELVIREAFNPCYFSSPGHHVVPPYSRSVKYCHPHQQTNMLYLMEHLKSRATDKDEALIGAEFGSLVRVIYLTETEEFLINPEFDDTGDSKLIQCIDDLGGYQVQRERPNRVRVKFLNSLFYEQTKVFSGSQACLLQSIAEIL